MKLSAFKFDLPHSLIAQYPLDDRDGARMMVLHRKTGKIEHKMFKDIVDYFDDGDVMIVVGPSKYKAALAPFIEWKNMKGIKTYFCPIQFLGPAENGT